MSIASLALPAHAAAASKVRIVNAIPGTAVAALSVGSSSTDGARYGMATPSAGMESGPVDWTLKIGGKVAATGSGVLEDGRNYTAVILAADTKPSVAFFADARSVPAGKARLRVIHAAPDFGMPDLVVDAKRVVNRLAFERATPYLALAPGKHSVKAVRSGTDTALLSAKGLRLPAKTATTAVVMGTRGIRTRLVTMRDFPIEATPSGKTTKPKSAKAAKPKLAKVTKSKVQKRTNVSATTPSSGSRNLTRHTIRSGESLWSIASDKLGDQATDAQIKREVRRIWKANASRIGSGDRNLIFPGTVLRLS